MDMQNAQTHCGSRRRRVFLTSGAATGIHTHFSHTPGRSHWHLVQHPRNRCKRSSFFALPDPQNRCCSRLRRVFFPLGAATNTSPIFPPTLGTATGVLSGVSGTTEAVVPMDIVEPANSLRQKRRGVFLTSGRSPKHLTHLPSHPWARPLALTPIFSHTLWRSH